MMTGTCKYCGEELPPGGTRGRTTHIECVLKESTRRITAKLNEQYGIKFTEGSHDKTQERGQGS